MLGVVWDAGDGLGGLIFRVVFWAGWLMVLIATFAVNHFDLFGLRQVYLYWSDKEYTAIKFQTTGFYKYLRHPIMLGDVSRAIRTVRARAAEWKLDPKRIGVMGSSAGGHLASTVVTHFDAGKADADDPVEKQSSRPDFGVLCYAVISMEDGVTHGGSKANLLGKTPDPQLVELLSNEKQVTKNTPPCFVWSTQEDKAVPVANSLRFVSALQQNGVAYDFHVYQKGPHGIGLSEGKNGVSSGDVHPWGKDLLFWLRQNGWIK